MISGKSLAKNFFIQTTGKFTSICIGLVTIALITRALGVEHFGEYTTAITFLQFFGVIVDFGLSLMLVIMISEPNTHEKKLVGNFLGLRLVSGLVLFSLAPIMVLAFPWSHTIKQAVLVGSFAYFLMGGATMLIGIFQKYESIWRSSVAELINRLVLLLTILVCVYFQLGVIAMMVGSVIANAIWFVCILLFARPFVRVVPLFDVDVWKKILVRSWPIAISILFNLMYLKGDVLLLAYFKTQTDVGMYGAAYRVLDVLTVLPTMFMGLLLPSLVHAWKNGDHITFKQRLSRTFDLFMLAVIPLMVGTQVVGVPLIQFIAGDGYEQGGEVLKILMLAMFGVFIGTLFGHLVVALDKQKTMIWGYGITAIITLAGYTLFIPAYGIWGAAWMTVFSELLVAIITAVLVYNASKAHVHLSVFFKSCLASAVMYTTLLSVPSWHVLVQILFAVGIYLVCMLLLKGITKEDLTIIMPQKAPRV